MISPAVLADFIDYAGMFPPAGLGLREAVLNYRAYVQSENKGALGRFIVPLHQLEKLAGVAAELPATAGDFDLPISCALPAEATQNCDTFRAAIEIAKQHHDVTATRALPPGVSQRMSRIESIEFAISSPDNLPAFCVEFPSEWQGFVEFPLDQMERYVPVIQQSSRLFGKLRMGGITHEKFPTTSQVFRGLKTLCGANVRFKCTAGLHHPLRGDYPLTYAIDAPRGAMHGFMNVLLTVVALRRKMPDSTAIPILEDGDSQHFRLTAQGLQWKDELFPWNEIIAARKDSFVAFGSCSFTEPLDDLAQLGWLG